MIRMTCGSVNFVVVLLLATYFVPSQAQETDHNMCTTQGLQMCMDQALDLPKGEVCRILKRVKMCLETMENVCQIGPIKAAAMATLNGVGITYYENCSPGKDLSTDTATCSPHSVTLCMDQVLYIPKNSDDPNGGIDTCKILQRVKACFDIMEAMCPDGPIKSAVMSTLNGVKMKHNEGCADHDPSQDTTCSTDSVTLCMDQVLYMPKTSDQPDSVIRTCKISKHIKKCLETMLVMCQNGPIKTAVISTLDGVEMKYNDRCEGIWMLAGQHHVNSFSDMLVKNPSATLGVVTTVILVLTLTVMAVLFLIQ